MKVAITNGWLVFDNERGDYEAQVPVRCRRGRVRMDALSSYTLGEEWSGWAPRPETVTLVWERGQPDAWRINGNHQELLDGYFGRSA